ncbi:MAG: hypothetical protein PHS81_02930 [Candidatus Nanoarchaeia archaeon]|nr:hypothetical protein [Candidatus Nanoarchaeia archaeon]
MIEEFKVNKRIKKKIEDSDFDEPFKRFLLKILDIEFYSVYNKNYSKDYENAIDFLYKQLEDMKND